MKIHRNPNPWRNNTLILMQTHGGMDRLVSKLWKWWENSGCDIIVSSPEDDPSEFDGPIIGKVISNPPSEYYHLQERALQLLRLAYKEHRDDYSDCLLLHYDVMFLSQIPRKRQAGLETRIDDSMNGNYVSPVNMTPPWWFDWDTLYSFREAALCHPITYEGGVMDRWIAALCHVHNIQSYQTDLIGYGRNCIQDDLDVVKQSILDGRPLVHGVKSEADIDWVLDVRSKL